MRIGIFFMRTSKYLLATLKETPTDAEVISHKLMLRAGMIRKLASGIYTWLPLGLRVLNKVENIVREEMDRSGAIELLLPSIQPAELWKESGRWEHYGKELLRLNDRHDREFCYGPTHEEVITSILRHELKSYKQLPINLYQIQTKFRDEIRPRFGVMRSREFLMKDAYSFNLDEKSLDESYQLMFETYNNIFNRLGLKFRSVFADTGSIGGSASQEFHVLAESGEDQIFYSDQSDYAANLELAEALSPKEERPNSNNKMSIVDTPQQRTIADIVDFLKIDIKQTVKTLLVHGENDKLVALIIRGDHELNSLKAEKHPLISEPLQFASEQEIVEAIDCNPGSIGPVELPLPILVDRSAANIADFSCGANSNDRHYINVNWERDLPMPEVFDLRNVNEGDPSPDGKGKLLMMRGIEVGHIFKLGTKYSEAMKATVLDENGKQVHLKMGCYGIGVSRIVAAAIEQNNDARGIIWPDAIAPFQIVLVPMNFHKSHRVRDASESLYKKLQENGYDVLLDDRNERAGVLFADSDLIGDWRKRD